jgi:hypothetical protein
MMCRYLGWICWVTVAAMGIGMLSRVDAAGKETEAAKKPALLNDYYDYRQMPIRNTDLLQMIEEADLILETAFTPRRGVPFVDIGAWEVSGPYEEEGKDGKGLFDVAFPPEDPDAKDVKWKPVNGTTVNLAKVVGGENRVAYLRAAVVSMNERKVRLELGSDDGVKVWLNGTQVHANNATRKRLRRGTDKLDVTLKEGANTLLLKITQNVKGWGATARLVNKDRSYLIGIQQVPPGGDADEAFGKMKEASQQEPRFKAVPGRRTFWTTRFKGKPGKELVILGDPEAFGNPPEGHVSMGSFAPQNAFLLFLKKEGEEENVYRCVKSNPAGFRRYRGKGYDHRTVWVGRVNGRLVVEGGPGYHGATMSGPRMMEHVLLGIEKAPGVKLTARALGGAAVEVSIENTADKPVKVPEQLPLRAPLLWAEIEGSERDSVLLARKD